MFCNLHANKYREISISKPKKSCLIIFNDQESFQFLSQFLPKFYFLTKNSILDQHFNFWQTKIRFSTKMLTKISMFDQNFDFWPKFRFLTKNHFSLKFQLFTKMSIFDQSFHFSPTFRFFTKIRIFHQSFDFWPKFQFLTLIFNFDL